MMEWIHEKYYSDFTKDNTFYCDFFYGYYNTYYVAWQFEAVRLFYSGSAENLSFINQIVNTINEMPLFLPIIFLGVSIPIILMMSGSRNKTDVNKGIILSIKFRNYTDQPGITEDYHKVREFFIKLEYAEFTYARWD